MNLENKKILRWMRHLQAIPVCLAALVMWAVFGGWYIAIVPSNVAGPDNRGIVISLLGLSLFISDRLARRWFNEGRPKLFFAVWVWGLALVLCGLFLWLLAWSGRHLAIFATHWFVLFIIISAWLWADRGRSRPE